MYNDADIEMAELAELAAEEDAETCPACREVGLFVTLYVSPRGERPHVERYECACGNVETWVDHRRTGRTVAEPEPDDLADAIADGDVRPLWWAR